MKGIIFSEFLKHVETVFGEEACETMILRSELPGSGAYTSVGTYDHAELVQLVTTLVELTGVQPSELLRDFGQCLFHRLAVGYGVMVGESNSGFDLLANVEGYIHVEVRKLYPDAELPTFEHEFTDQDTMVLTYRSDRGFADVAEGLIRGCFEHFGEDVEISREDLGDGSGRHARFTLNRKTRDG
jgi:hypothetical protein